MVVKKVPVRLARVIRDCRDARLDIYIPLADAVLLYRAGKIHFDVTNGEYSVSADQWKNVVKLQVAK